MKVKIVDCEKDKLQPEEVRRLILTSDKAVKHAILFLYSYQTEGERFSMFNGCKNGVGFNRYDSPYLSQLALKLREFDYISQEDIYKARVKLVKYSNQIAKLVNAKRDVQLEWRM